jgi:large subunit ribosomal protein L25
MKNEQLVVEAEIREGKSTDGGLRKLRQAEKLPAVIYGGKKPPITVIVSERALRKAIRTGGSNAILTLKHPKGEDTVIVKEVAKDVVSSAPIHVDFQRISLKEKIVVKVHIKIVGEAPGVKLQGGIMEHILREVEVRCLPTEIPHELLIDVSGLNIAQSLHVKDIQRPADLEILQTEDQIVVNVVAPKAEEVAAPAAAEGAAAEPEISAQKGKKEEEGAEGEKGKAPAAGAKPGAAPAAEKGKAPAAGEKKAPEKK